MDKLRRLFRPLFDPNNEGAGGAGGGGGNQGAGGGAATAELPEWVNTTFGEDVRTSPDYAPLFTPDAKGNAPDMAKHKTPADFLKNYKNLNETVGRKGIIVPNEKSTKEEIEAFQIALGRPKTAAEYKLDDVKDLHEGIKATPESAQAFFGVAHKLGLTNAQANGLNQWFLSTMSGQMKQSEEAKIKSTQETETALRTEWGGEYDANIKAASTFVERMGGKEALEAFNADGTGRNPVLLRVFAKAGKMISEDGTPPRGGAGNESVEQQIAAQLNDPKSAYRDEAHPEHKDWVGPTGKMQKLYQKREAEAKGGK